MSQKNLSHNKFEDKLLVIILMLMTLLTFANVVARYVFNSNIFYALELTVFLFAWLVLIGASYSVKNNIHIGVDALLNFFPLHIRKILTLIAVFICISYAFVLLKGSWDYWAPYANLPPTEGHLIPTGFSDNYRGQGWYETQDIPVPFFLTWLADVFNAGEPYEKIPKLIPYLILPVAMFLLVVRYIYAALRIIRGEQTLLIVNHEAEDDIKS